MNRFPPELKNIFSTLMASQDKQMRGEAVSDDEIMNCFENIIQTNGLNREEFFHSIQNDNGEIDIKKVEHFLQRDE